MTTYELIYWSYRLPALRKIVLSELFSTDRECLYTCSALLQLDQASNGPCFGRN